ncbi:hypothetical protein M768_07525 [Cellulosimicrobium cellulans F16]|uniref:Uncharacterized protein n=1 Tax=Cellulosimicrobium cellulans F16 TaxID=1350482 RepID=A0A0M0F921_CELCE|nr:DUF5719 family protein [Cellulosimicrobium cellulans]KON73948.1 hypothetical protein M768_07525 [Cellulosimicrobium cellulans F16]
MTTQDETGQGQAAPDEAGAGTSRGRRRGVVRRVTTTGAGLVGMLAAGAVAAFGSTGATLVPAAPAPVDAVEHVAVEPGPEVTVCPGPARLTDPETVGDAQFGPAPVGTESSLRAVVEGDGSAELGAFDGTAARADARTLERAPDADATVSTVEDPAAGTVLTVRPGEGAGPRVAASVGSVTTAGDLRGLAAASCARPGISQWLVGGSTQIGSSTQLVLQNPGLTPAVVQVDVWGQGGAAVLSGGGQQLVGPGEEVVTLVEAAAPEQRRLVVHVSATGGLVSAYLQHSTLDGLVPLGVDYVVPGAEPAHDLALSGVASAGEAVDDPHAPQLRLLAPGDAAGTARVTVFGADGPVPLRGVEDVALTPGVVTDVSLGGLPAGSYAVAVHADVPVVAGVSVDRRGEADPDLLHEERQYDRAWVAARALAPATSAPAGGDAPVDEDGARAGQVALVPGTSSALTLAAVPTTEAAEDGDDAAGRLELRVRAYDEDGAEAGTTTVTLASGTAQTLDPSTLRAEGSEAVVAAVTVDVVGPRGDLDPVWSVTASAGPPSGDDGDETPSLLSVLLPVVDAPAPGEVAVRASDTAGLGD